MGGVNLDDNGEVGDSVEIIGLKVGTATEGDKEGLEVMLAELEAWLLSVAEEDDNNDMTKDDDG